MLPVTASSIRLFLHVLAATVWVGGQVTLAGLVPTLRDLGDDAPGAVARRFNRIAWPAFAVLVLTGVWNLVAIDVADTSIEYQITLFLKLPASERDPIRACCVATAKKYTVEENALQTASVFEEVLREKSRV